MHLHIELLQNYGRPHSYCDFLENILHALISVRLVVLKPPALPAWLVFPGNTSSGITLIFDILRYSEKRRKNFFLLE